MKTHFLILFLIFIICYPASSANNQEDDLPIIAYWGVTEKDMSEDAFRLFRECGFTVSIFPYSSLISLQTACKLAWKSGVKIIGNCPEMSASPDQVASTLKTEKGFWGYLIKDEPNNIEIGEQLTKIRKIATVDNEHILYINLFPYYNPNLVKSSLKADSYSDYLRTASRTPCQQISFDFYPITTKGIRQTWYYNLEMIRNESKNCGKPFWGFVLCTPHDVPYDKGNYYPNPTLASLRLQIYSNLSYGAQAIQYFTYWTPDGSDNFHFYNGPIGLNGKRTKTYYLVQQMNRELKTVSKLFYSAKVLSVHHLGGIMPEGTTKQSQMPLNLKSLKVVSSKGAIISQLEKNTHRYLAIVNKDYENNIKVIVKPLNSTPRHLTKTLKEEPMKETYSISAGDILLFRLK